MYISGNLIQEKIKENHDLILAFDHQKIIFQNFDLSYDGQLELITPENQTKEKLFWEQEEKIMLLYKTILTKTKRPKVNGYIEAYTLNLVKSILKSSYKYIYLLLETLNYIINNSFNLYLDLQDFAKFYQYLVFNDLTLNQIELNILIKRFLKDNTYNVANLNTYKKEIFGIDIEKLDSQSQAVATFGEFIKPNRVLKIAPYIQNNPEFTQYIAPIYFLLPTSKDASTFLYLNRHPDYNFKTIYRYAQKCGATPNILKLIKKGF